MRVLITGVEGFIGHNLSDFFKNKHYTVFAPTFEELDLRNDNAVADYLKDKPIDCIVHCATTLRNGTTYPPDTCENNLRMFFNLEKHRSQSTKLINLGSGSEYSRAFWYKKMPEDFFDQHIPRDCHSYAKYLISKYIQEHNNGTLISLRIFGIFGKYEDYRYKFISNAIAKNILGLPLVINQNVIYDYIYIDDFFKIIEFFVNNQTKGNIFNITPTQSIDLLTIVKLINKISDSISEIQVLNEGVGIEYSGDNAALLDEIGDFCFTDYETAISELHNFYDNSKADLDIESLQQDTFLNYAKKLKSEYFKE